MESKKARSLAAKRGWATRRAKAKERSDRAKRGWKTRRKNARTNRKLSRKSLERKQDGQGKKKIESIAQWNALDFSDTEEIEIVSNADY